MSQRVTSGPAGVSAGQVAGLLGGRVIGDAATLLSGFSALADAGPGELSFFSNPKYESQLATTRAAAVLVGAEHPVLTGRGVAQVVVANPDAALGALVQQFAPPPERPATGTHPSAVIADGALIGENVAIGPFVVIGAGAKIGSGTAIHAHVAIGSGATVGRDCLIWPQVTIRERCTVGSRVILHPGVVIGSDGFGYAPLDGRHMKIPQVGNVVVEDDVEIGANTTVDRARFGTTRIGAGTKIDNLVQVAHNVQIGAHCLIAAQAGIAGSTKLADRVALGGQSGLAGHIELGEGVMVAGQSGVSKNQPAGAILRGSPAIDHELAKQLDVNLRRLARGGEELRVIRDLNDRIAALERRLESLASAEPL